MATLESPSHPASYPTKALLLPPTSALPARVPNNAFLDPVVTFAPASYPTIALFASVRTSLTLLMPTTNASESVDLALYSDPRTMALAILAPTSLMPVATLDPMRTASFAYQRFELKVPCSAHPSTTLLLPVRNWPAAGPRHTLFVVSLDRIIALGPIAASAYEFSDSHPARYPKNVLFSAPFSPAPAAGPMHTTFSVLFETYRAASPIPTVREELLAYQPASLPTNAPSLTLRLLSPARHPMATLQSPSPPAS